MALTARQIGRFFFIAISALIILSFLLVCLTPYSSFGVFRLTSLLGFLFPFLLLCVLALLIFFIIKKSKWFILPVCVLLLGWQQIAVCFAFNFRNSGNDLGIKQDGNLRILSWNVARWDEANRDIRGGQSFRNLMLDWVKGMDADILCFQEFFECYNPTFSDQNIIAIQKMGYPYHYFFPSSIVFEGAFQFGLCIFSRYPILDSAKYSEAIGEHSEGFCYADVDVNGKRVRVFNTHLESFGIRLSGNSWVSGIRKEEGLLRKINNSYKLRNIQAANLRRVVDSSRYPTIVCGDIDDVPNSSAYFKVRGSMRDAFLDKSIGFGHSYQFWLPTLRIDYLLLDKRFKTVFCERKKIPYSDHYPIIADIRLINEEQ